MSAHRFPHYLRSYRRNNGFSQQEVAWLLGCKSVNNVSEHERFARVPKLENLLAYEVIFQAPVRDLFGGTFEVVEFVTQQRARLLLERIAQAEPGPHSELKMARLQAILESVDRRNASGGHA